MTSTRRQHRKVAPRGAVIRMLAALLAGAAAMTPAHADRTAAEPAGPQPPPSADPPLFDLAREKVLYCVGYAHLDTQWRWDFCTTIDQYIHDTLTQNFDRFERFPGYVFNFTGSVRYEMMKEYYPELYAKLKEYVAAGRWHVSGSSVDEGDVNVPSPESIIRQVLYGNQFFRREFGKESVDFMLPDCFGFPASMPSIWAHCGLKGFSTQKLTWGSAVGIPFKIGVWEGPDRNGVIAAFDPGPYVGAIAGPVDTNPQWVARVNANGQKYGVWADYHYYGVGDQGGAPKAEDIANYLASASNRAATVSRAATVRERFEAGANPADQRAADSAQTSDEAKPKTSDEATQRRSDEGKDQTTTTGASAAPSPSAPPQPDMATQPADRVRVALTSSDQLFKDITPAMRAGLPRYSGDLLLTEHSAGTLTSQAYMKRWNRKNENLADAAERMAVAAHWLGTATYPREKLYKSWVRVLANQMHDILPGTSIPRAYRYSWNDEIVALNGFAEVLQDSVGAAARGLGYPGAEANLIVYNPLAIEREELITFELDTRIIGRTVSGVRVTDLLGFEKRVHCERIHGIQAFRVIFVDRLPPVSLTAYRVDADDRTVDEKPKFLAKEAEGQALRITERELENSYYLVRLNDDGDVTSIYDKRFKQEVLAAPAQLVFTREKPREWPAWNMDWVDRQKPPIDVVRGPAKFRIVESGPFRVALEVERAARNSIIKQQIRLAIGDTGRYVEFKTEIDWQSTECALKASFPLVASNPKATYNWGLGTIERGNNEPTKYEVPAHEWIDLTDHDGQFGVSILEDSKYGSDKPNDNTLRLTLLYTPGVRKSYMDQHSQDWGQHEMTYALYSHPGTWQTGRTEWMARRLNQPLKAFIATKPISPTIADKPQISFASLNTDQVDLRTMKLAEDNDWTIVRLQELWGRTAEKVVLTTYGRIEEACEVDGQERRIANATLQDGALVTTLPSYGLRSFALRISKLPESPIGTLFQTIELKYDADVVSTDAENRAAEAGAGGGMDAVGLCYPAEELPRKIVSEGIPFELGPTDGNKPQAVTCRGQKISLESLKRLPPPATASIYLLAAATREARGVFLLNDRPVELRILPWRGFLGQWDDREWDKEFGEVDHVCDGKAIGLRNGFINREPWAWFATHHHVPGGGNAAYQFCYLFKYRLDLKFPEQSITLPDEPDIKIFAMTAAYNPNDCVTPAAPLYDDFSNRQALQLRHQYPPPPKAVYDGVPARGVVKTERIDPTAASLQPLDSPYAALKIGPPSKTDYASRVAFRGPVFRVYDPDGALPPHSGSGVKDGGLPRLSDGYFALNDDDTQRCVWYDGPGRFFLRFDEPREVTRINAYSWHRDNRAPQHFSVWGWRAAKVGENVGTWEGGKVEEGRAGAAPPMSFTHGEHGTWDLLGVVDTRALGDAGIHASSIAAQDAGPLGRYSHLLWIAEDIGQGTFFTEVDVHVAE